MGRAPGSSRAVPRRVAGSCLAVAALAAAVAYNQSAVHWRANHVDSDLFEYYGWCVSRGAVPYLDIWDNKPPGIWWTNAAAFALFGDGNVGPWIASLAALLVGMAAFVGIARAAFGRSMVWLAVPTAAVLLTHLAFECGANRTETYLVACETLAVLCYVQWMRRRAAPWLLLVGIAGGVAPWFKQSGLAAIVACTIHLVLETGSAADASTPSRDAERGAPASQGPTFAAFFTLLAGFVLVQIAGATVLAAQGALTEAWFAVAAFNRAYFVIGDARWLPTGEPLRLAAERLAALGPLWLVVTIAGIVSVGRRLTRRRAFSSSIARDFDMLLWSWLLLSIYLACVGPGRQGHHFMPCLPPLGLIALTPLAWMVAPDGLARRLAARPTIALLVAAYGIVLVDAGSSSLAEARGCWERKPAWWSLRRAQPKDIEWQGERVRSLCGSDEHVYAWGWSPGTYRFAYRLPGSRFATLEKAGQVGNFADFIVRGAIEDIRAAPPAVFVVSIADRGAMSEAHTDFATWLEQTYEERDLVEGMYILRRR